MRDRGCNAHATSVTRERRGVAYARTRNVPAIAATARRRMQQQHSNAALSGERRSSTLHETQWNASSTIMIDVGHFERAATCVRRMGTAEGADLGDERKNE